MASKEISKNNYKEIIKTKIDRKKKENERRKKRRAKASFPTLCLNRKGDQ